MALSHLVPKRQWNIGVAHTARNPSDGSTRYAVKRFILVLTRMNRSLSSCTWDRPGRNAEVTVCEMVVIPILLHLSAWV